MDEINYNDQDLDNLITLDKKYYAKGRKKLLLILIPILIVLIAVIIVLIIVLGQKDTNKIICEYSTNKDNENIPLINIKNNSDFTLIIDGVKNDKKNYHIFEKAGRHNVIFEFKNKLDSLESFFEGNQYLINADFSQLKAENIKSTANLFKNCSHLNNVTFDNETPNLENIRYMFYNCNSLETVNLNINTSKVINPLN